MLRNGASAWGVSLVQVQREGLGIVGNPSTTPLLGVGVDVDEGRAFLPAKEGSVALLAPWPPWSLAVSLESAMDRGPGASWNRR